MNIEVEFDESLEQRSAKFLSKESENKHYRISGCVMSVATKGIIDKGRQIVISVFQ